jgi:prolyl-tRNA synthetase
MVLADTGEDVIISCDACGYAANLEKAEAGFAEQEISARKGHYRRVATPGQKRVDEVASFLNVTPDKLIKTIIYRTDKGIIGALVKGDREINETKLVNLLSLDYLELADPYTIEEVTGGPLGFSGPIGLSIPLYADSDVRFMEDFVIGGNEEDVHVVDVNPADFKVEGFTT